MENFTKHGGFEINVKPWEDSGGYAVELRFADLQRTKLSSLSYDKIWQYDSSWPFFSHEDEQSGCPLGLVCEGFISEGSFTWAHRFFTGNLIAFILNTIFLHTKWILWSPASTLIQMQRALFPCPTRRHCGIPYTTFSAEAFKPCWSFGM